MKKLVCYWDEATNLNLNVKTQKRLLKMWTHTAKGFGIDQLIVIDPKEMTPVIVDLELDIVHYKTVQEVYEANKDYTFIIATEEGSDITHITLPKDNIVYMVGSNYSNPPTRTGDVLAKIDADIPLWDIIAASIMMERIR